MSDSDFTKINRRGVLQCMAWAGAGLLWTARGGTPVSMGIESAHGATAEGGLTFVQVSDSHIGFDKAANPDARASFREAIAKIRALPSKPAFIVHTGDITQLSKPNEFDDAEQIIKEAGLPVFYVPGEHDMLDEGGGKAYLERFGKGTRGTGWYSFDSHGVHFVALNNVANLKPGGMGSLGNDQLEWLEADLKGRSASTPIVVLAHMPLWSLYPQWGWGTDDADRATSYLRRFGSVTVLNGHIHQITQQMEGKIAFYTARSTAFPQPAPGAGAGPGPLKVPTEQLHGVLGIRSLSVVGRNQPLAITDMSLADGGTPTAAAAAAGAAAGGGTTTGTAQAATAAGETVRIGNFAFGPNTTTIRAGQTVTWINDDDDPHTVSATDGTFRSKTLDTADRYDFTFGQPGEFAYFCTLHPHMTGKVVVRRE
ncbi:MAG TPA: metallophosphoesterase [Steroidobacteraceae bacterium]|jgi:plastocyanin